MKSRKKMLAVVLSLCAAIGIAVYVRTKLPPPRSGPAVANAVTPVSV